MHTHIHTFIHSCIHTYTHTHTYIHTYIHTHIHTYIHTYIPISAIYREAAEEATRKWQEQWTKTSKAEATKQYFPTVMERIGTKINLIPKLTAVLSGRGKTRAYLYQFNLREEAKCICNKDDQTMDHLLFHCTKASTQRPDKTN